MSRDLRPLEERKGFIEKELQPDGSYKKPATKKKKKEKPIEGIYGVVPTKRMSTKKRQEVTKEINMKKCRYCHSTENLTLDHKIPIIKGGSNEKKNLQCLCSRCNSIKNDR